MAATRLSDSQKQELVARFRSGEASAALAEAFGCSANTVSRVVRTALAPKDYQALKQQRGRSAGQVAAPAGGSNLQLPLPDEGSEADDLAASPQGEVLGSTPQAGSALGEVGPESPTRGQDDDKADPAPATIFGAPAAGGPTPTTASDLEPQFGGWVRHQVGGAEDLGREQGVGQAMATAFAAQADGPGPDSQESPNGDLDQGEDPDQDQGHAALAIDDADDFAEEAGDDEGEEIEDGSEDGTEDGDSFVGRYGGSNQGDGQTFMVLPLGQTIEDRPSLTVQPLEPADLPASVYMLVDKTVELDIKPLKELPELGTLPAGEEDRQALVVYANPRQAKRYCGRNQRVIKVPDSGVLARTAPYLLSQGVTRLVVEGALYSLPGS